MILVTGASGNVGAELVGAIRRAGEPVRALIRSADRELPAGVERAAGDLNEPQSLAAALLTARHDGQAYRVSGPQRLLPADRVRILAAVLGRDLRFAAQSDTEARAEMSTNTPAEYVNAFFSFYAGGALDESQVLPPVQDVMGTPPRTFEQWATAHAHAFT